MPTSKPVHDSLVSRLVDEPLLVPARLADILASEASVCNKLLQFSPRSLRPSDKQKIDELDRVVEAYLQSKGKKDLYPDWKGPSDRLREICDYGVSGRTETIAAMMLAGAAVARSDIAVAGGKGERLRPDLSPGLLDVCAKHRQSPPPSKQHPLADAYKSLRIDLAKSRLAPRMLTILTDVKQVPRLRLGKPLSALDPKVIEEYRRKYFGGSERHLGTGRRQGQLLQDDSLPRPALTAPDVVELELARAACDQQQDSTGSDAIFWVSYFAYVKNLASLFDQIDAAIKSGSFAQVELDVQTETRARQSQLVPFNTGDDKAIGMTLGNVDLIQGFGPWHCQLVCYEDDNQEYVAVQEVLDTIGDYASYVSKGAQIVTAVSGPTVVGAGAAAVGTVASSVQLAAEVGSAVVSIVNLLDENDYIGTARFSAQGDYVGIPPGNVSLPEAKVGQYRLSVAEKRTGVEQVTRNWEVALTSGKGETYKNEGGVCPGISENIPFRFKMDAYTDKALHFWIDHVCVAEGGRGDRGWWGWITEPVLSADDHLTVVGAFHVGQDGYGKLADTPFAQGIRLLQPPL